MIGKNFSHYKILEKLGSGGMGEVFKAEDTRLNRTVALKFLPLDLTRNEDSKKRFNQEAQTASTLQHNNICTIHDVSETEEGQLYIVMDFYEGDTIKQLVKRGPLEVDKALDITIQVAQGLNAAHEKQITHRDIKPGNIIIAKDGTVKIIDFGLAKLAWQTRLTRTGTTLGTAAYMSPEQTSGEEVDHRADIWSLGVILYEMLTGLTPFKGDYEQAVVYSIVNEEPKPITGLRTGIPIELERVVNKAMAKNPDDRYQHIDEMIVDLRWLIQETDSQEISALHFIGSKKKRKIWPVISIGIVFIIILGIITFTSLSKSAGHLSIGILYMENLGDDQDEFWVRGLTEDLIIDVASVGPSVRVSPIKDIIKYKNSEMQMEEIARDLRVQYLLSSSFHKQNGRFDLRCQIIEAATGKNIFANRWSEPIERIETVTNSLTEEILSSLSISVSSEAIIVEIASPGAYENYLRGKFRWENRENQRDVESAMNNIRTAIELDPNFLSAKLKLGKMYFDIGEYDRSEQELIKCLDQARANNDKLIEMESILSLGNIQFAKAEYDSASVHYFSALEIARSLEERDREGDILNNIGNVHLKKYDYQEGIKFYSESIKIAVELDDVAGEGEVRNNLGAVFLELKDFDRALSSYERSLEIFKQLETRDNEFSSMQGIGLIYLYKGDFILALGYFDESLEFARGINDKRSEAYALMNIGDVYFLLDQYDLARSYFKDCIAISLLLEDLYNIGFSYQRMGEIGLRENKFGESKQYFNLANNIWHKLKDQSHNAWTLSSLALAELKIGNQDSAIVLSDQVESILSISIPYESLVISVHWNMYNIYSEIGNNENAELHLIKAYNMVVKNSTTFTEIKDSKAYLNNYSENKNIVKTYDLVLGRN
jgi:serine/threonine protein kinase/Tfp pilus assembly protein PilF